MGRHSRPKRKLSTLPRVRVGLRMLWWMVALVIVGAIVTGLTLMLVEGAQEELRQAVGAGRVGGPILLV